MQIHVQFTNYKVLLRMNNERMKWKSNLQAMAVGGTDRASFVGTRHAAFPRIPVGVPLVGTQTINQFSGQPQGIAPTGVRPVFFFTSVSKKSCFFYFISISSKGDVA